MLPLNDFYLLCTFLSSLLMAILGVFLLTGSFSVFDRELKSYFVARRILAVAYIILAIPGFWEVCSGGFSDFTSVKPVFTVLIAFFQAPLFTFALIVLLQPLSLASGLFVRYIITGIWMAVLLLISWNYLPATFFQWVLYGTMVMYAGVVLKLTRLFRSLIKNKENLLTEFNAHSRNYCLYWIIRVFYIALGIGVLACCSVFFPKEWYTFFIVGYTLFYVYLALKYVEYVRFFHQEVQIVPLAEEKKEIEEKGQEGGKREFEEVIAKWVAEKRFIENDDFNELLTEVGTNRTYLSRYINLNMGCNYRTWINRLRLEEAGKILHECSDIPVMEVADRVGLSKSSFYRLVQAHYHCTPQEWCNSLRSTVAG